MRLQGLLQSPRIRVTNENSGTGLDKVQRGLQADAAGCGGDQYALWLQLNPDLCDFQKR
jgi:hypothetical protein